ncbi:LytTR family transcriptional regulator [Gracilibacillus oryzae]|uniref:LytTR family transcriptional regulator n=1 Tax=Gracilibacillus oryzae TaxID=1672701 RepID=A0A7C8GTX6_9BACI|nr:LytTR family DNA-binding domain-containing protein [Gracilibacillus oryzae]KAB8137775.1 LytTR family transcriptional regulator [Gracilibacillus oryzae]
MKINIDINDEHTEPSITIQTNEWTEELEEIITIIRGKHRKRLFGIESDQTVLLDPNDIDFVYSEKRKVFACIGSRNVEIKMKLYEIEVILAPYNFMRFSKSVIGNLNHIDCFELSFNGNLCVYFHSGCKEYISRKYVVPIKNRLDMGGEPDDNGSN